MYQKDSYLTDMLAVVAQNWVDEFRKTWGLDATTPPIGMTQLDWEFAKAFDEIAAQIVTSSRTLERNRSNLEKRLNTLRDILGQELEQDKLFSHFLEAHIVSDLEDELDRMRHRSLKLVRYLVHVKSEPARSYLARVGACFLRGLKTETLVMAAAVVDAALKESLEDGEVRDLIRCGKYVSFGNRILFMKESRRWDKDTAQKAFDLKDERNDAIHVEPDLNRSVDEVMEDLVFLLSKLSFPPDFIV
jgi:hypothetical protein